MLIDTGIFYPFSLHGAPHVYLSGSRLGCSCTRYGVFEKYLSDSLESQPTRMAFPSPIVEIQEQSSKKSFMRFGSRKLVLGHSGVWLSSLNPSSNRNTWLPCPLWLQSKAKLGRIAGVLLSRTTAFIRSYHDYAWCTGDVPPLAGCWHSCYQCC